MVFSNIKTIKFYSLKIVKNSYFIRFYTIIININKIFLCYTFNNNLSLLNVAIVLQEDKELTLFSINMHFIPRYSIVKKQKCRNCANLLTTHYNVTRLRDFNVRMCIDSRAFSATHRLEIIWHHSIEFIANCDLFLNFYGVFA